MNCSQLKEGRLKLVGSSDGSALGEKVGGGVGIEILTAAAGNGRGGGVATGVIGDAATANVGAGSALRGVAGAGCLRSFFSSVPSR